MNNRGLKFYPLYWMFHDNWIFRTSYQDNYGYWTVDHNHRGHMHFFMTGFKYDTQQAYTGAQTYSFNLDDIWSERSGDVNQQYNMKIVGTPKWYFHVKEYWRRVYVQWWDHVTNSIIPSDKILGRKGIKYDASSYTHTRGPYRETKDNFVYGMNCTRTLPIEYWKNEKKTVRDHFVRNDAGEGFHVWDYEEVDESASRMLPPQDAVLVGTQGSADNDASRFNKERNYGYPDFEYMFPTLESQSFTQLDWERPPGWEDRDIDDQHFGDGFSIDIQIPMRDKNGVVLSPFSDDEGNVSPPGEYFHDFMEKHPDKILKYPTENPPHSTNPNPDDNIVYTPDMYNIPDELKGQPVQWHVPEHLQGLEDGMWVEQCLGGIVLAKAQVTLEDNFGGRHEVWVTDQQFVVAEDFEGSDQNAPA